VAAADAALARESDTALTRDAWICRTRALLTQEDAGQAMAAAREAVRVDPAHAGALVELANALAMSDRWGEARAVIARAEALAPEDPWALDNRRAIDEGLLAIEDGVTEAESGVEKRS
jgi:Flp pilus assembly protein TadD